MSTTTPTNGTPQAAAPGDGSSAAGAAHDGVHDWRHEDPDPNPDQLDHLVMGRHQNGSTGPTTRLSPPLPTPPRLKRRGSGNAVVLPAVTIDTGSSARISLPPSNGSRSNSGSEANSPITPSSLLTPDGKYRGGRHRQRSSTVTGQQQPLGSPRATVTTTTPPLPLMTDVASRLALLATNEEDEAAATGASLATRNAGMTPPRQRKGTSSSEHGAASAAISAATSSSTATSVSYTEDTPSSPSTPSSPFQRTLFMARKQGPSGERRRSMVASIPGSPVYPPHDADHSARAPPSPREAAINGPNSLGLIAAAVLSAAAVSAGTGATHQVVQSSPKPSQRSYQRSTSTVQMNHQAAADAASTDAAGATPYGSPTKPTMGSPKLTRYADKPLPPIPSHPPQRFRSPSANDANLPVRTRSLSATPSGDRAKSEDLARPPISPISPNTATASGGSSSLAAAMKAYRTIRSRVTQPLLKPATNGPGERPHEESHPAPGAAVEEDVERKKVI